MEFLEDCGWGYDPDYPLADRDDDDVDNRPVDPDSWSNEDLEGGF